MEIMLSTDQVIERALEVAIKENVPFQYNDDTIINLKELYRFCESNLKDGFTFEEIVKEVIDKAQTTAGPSCSYELGAYETKSGHAENIVFEVETEYDEEEDTVTYTLTFSY